MFPSFWEHFRKNNISKYIETWWQQPYFLFPLQSFIQYTFSWSKNLPNFTITAACAVAVYGQRQFRQGRTGAGNGYGAPPGGQAEYQPSASSGSQSAAAPGGDDHQGLDWLLKSVPGQPGTDYPIFAEAPETSFACDGQVEGGKKWNQSLIDTICF